MMRTRIAPGVGANLLGQHSEERNNDQEATTVYVGNLDAAKVTEELLGELFVHAGPVVSVHIPKDQSYGFVVFQSEEDADYAIKIFNMIKLYGKPMRVNRRARVGEDNKKRKSVESDVFGANLFIGKLDPDVDEKLLYGTFSAFGVIVKDPKIMRDPETGNSRGFGFISFGSFEASDAAIEAMNGQFLCNRQIEVSYAYKKDSTTKGVRHGNPAERALAASYDWDSRPPAYVIIMRLWGKSGAIIVADYKNDLFLLQFLTDLLSRAPFGGPWHVGSVPKIQKLDMAVFIPLVWVQQDNVPIELHTKEGLSYLASTIGKSLHMDQIARSYLEQIVLTFV
ncbi:Splicing factor 3B subunit 4 [Turnera subulata]|uniref:Splicing factor 3B subunit 4 n=1 Tax=Turnera subulata TaxID=218843 RepID=A0A9Q0FTC2_9ROSI|nr:Splicing factor 3B subunit 4 [Turnera subulata]